MAYLLEVESSFEAAHRLPEYNGPCRREHGHHWVIHALYRATELDKQGIAIDLVELKRLLHEVIAPFDHNSLNKIMSCNPTSENLAKLVFAQLRCLRYGDNLVRVVVEETPGSTVYYREDENENK